MPKSLIATVLALAAAGSSMQAQSKGDSWDLGLKIRIGVTSGDLKDDMYSEKMLGLGLEGTWALSSDRFLVGELAYMRFPGKDQLLVLPSTVTFSSSTDRRKNELEGFSFRFGYRAPLASTGWNWQGGLSLDKLKSRQEAAGQLTVGSTVESIAATPTDSKLQPGAWIGLQAKVGEDFSFETNLFSVGYSKAEWVPSTYSGKAAGSTTSTKRGFGLEVAIGFKF